MTEPAASKPAVAQLVSLLGSDCVRTDAGELAPLLVDHRSLYHGSAAALLLPRSVEQVATALAFCNAHRVPVVPQGGNTSYCGGATPDGSGAQIILSLSRLNRVRNVDPLNYSMTVEAGCLLAAAQRAAADADRFFPLSLGSEGSCQIGGNLSTNAGGTSVLRYGMMRELVLGLEVVLPDGRLLNALTSLRKDNTGYDVKSLFSRCRRHARRHHRGDAQTVPSNPQRCHRLRGRGERADRGRTAQPPARAKR